MGGVGCWVYGVRAGWYLERLQGVELLGVQVVQ
jgi:hypothetical protein